MIQIQQPRYLRTQIKHSAKGHYDCFVEVTKIVKNTATIEYLSKGWKDEPIGSTDKVHLNRLKVAFERRSFPPQPPKLVEFVESLIARGEVGESFRSFIEVWCESS